MDHSSNPKEENVPASFEDSVWEEGFEVRVFAVRPTHGREGEQPRGEPGVKNILILGELNQLSFDAVLLFCFCVRFFKVPGEDPILIFR